MEVVHGKPLSQLVITEQLHDVEQFLAGLQRSTQVIQFLFIVQRRDLLRE